MVSLLVAGTAIVGFSSVLGSIGTLATMAGTAIGLIAGTIGFLLSPIGLVSAAIVGLGGYFLYSTGMMGDAMDWLKDQFGSLFRFAGDTFQGICDAIMAGDLSLAFEVATSALKLVWLKASHWLLDKWYAITMGIQDAWANATTWLAGQFVNATAAISKSWVTLISSLKIAWAGYQNWWQKQMNYIVGKAMGADDATIESMNRADDQRFMGNVLAADSGMEKQLAEIDANKSGALATLQVDFNVFGF